MKICLIGPGMMPIPPSGWGGCEALMWNLKCELERQGQEVLIVNTKDLKEVHTKVNDWSPDFVHLHYDAYADIMPYINAPRAMTSHYPYLDFPKKRGGYEWIFHKFAANHSYVFSLSDRNTEHFKHFGVRDDLIWDWWGGVSEEKFSFSKEPSKSDRTICLGKIESRKMQHFLQSVSDNIDFAGPVADDRFDKNKNYLGVWSRDQVHSDLTEYSNMVLLSDGEAAPQVIMEALVAGLGVVVSEEGSANLDTELPFITVVKSSWTADKINNAIEDNRTLCVQMREKIREYGIERFGLSSCTKKYIEKIVKIRAEK
jgi:glycosyltransferase involved in cell wall biosynthesis